MQTIDDIRSYTIRIQSHSLVTLQYPKIIWHSEIFYLCLLYVKTVNEKDYQTAYFYFFVTGLFAFEHSVFIQRFSCTCKKNLYLQTKYCDLSKLHTMPMPFWAFCFISNQTITLSFNIYNISCLLYWWNYKATTDKGLWRMAFIH